MPNGGGPDRPGRGAIAASVALHALLLLGAVAVGLRAGTEVPEFEVYRVSIISPAPQVQGPPQPVATTATPEPEPPPPEPEIVEPTPAPKRAPKPEPKKVEPKKTTPAPQQPEKPKPAEPVASSGREPDPTSEGGEGLNVDIEGVACPSPAYCENIIRQAHRHFRWSGPPLTSMVHFVIRRDGSVEQIRTLRSSGNINFDFAVQAAIEAAGNRGAFGALPAEFQRDQLPVQLRFTPPG